MSKHPIEDCQYYIWEENRFASYAVFKKFYAAKDAEDTKFRNFCLEEWAKYAMNYDKEDRLSYLVWLVKNEKELKEKWKTTK